jgi:hypothetical protein
MKKFFLLQIIFLLSLTACNFFEQVYCGKQTKRQIEIINYFNDQYKNLMKVEADPCEPEYLFITLQSDSISEIILIKLHHELDSIFPNSYNWKHLMVYNKKNESLLYEHWINNGEIIKGNGNSR